MVQFRHDENVNYALYSPEDKAWAAGFIDGDGMISFFRRVESGRCDEFFVKVSAVNTCKDPLEKLQLMFGGSINQMHSKEKHSRWADSWCWSVTHRNAERVIRALSSYLIAKHSQAILALSARELVGDRHKRRDKPTLMKLAEIETQFRELNRKG